MSQIRYLEEFRAPEAVGHLAKKLASFPQPDREMTFMEICGTHTMSIFRFGIRQLLPPWVRLISGPGCPVCVTDDQFIAQACAIGLEHDAVIVTFGDLMPVPGIDMSLEQARARGADVRVVYTPHQCLELAREEPEKAFVYLAVGFETTAPLTAALVLEAEAKKIDNVFLLGAHKLVPPAMKALIADQKLNIDGFICPPHVSAVIGSRPFEFIANDWKRPCVVAGFESADILLGLVTLVEMIRDNRFEVINHYRRVVRRDGNRHAQKMVDDAYEPCDDVWRGIGMIPQSGLSLRSHLSHRDASRRFPVTIPPKKPTKCRCGDVLRGLITPKQCPLFGKACHPDHPLGPCMVSSEGTCAAYFKYDQ